MNAPFVFPSTAGEVLPCPLCKTHGNSLVIAEQGIEQRFAMPVLPVRDYHQARCGGCGLFYINGPVDQSYLNELYANETVDWAAAVLGSDEARMNDDERARFAEVVGIVSRFKKLSGAEWLDFGCQTGELGDDAIRKHGVVMSGVEISDDYSERSAKLWNRPRESVQTSLAAHSQRFDVISSLETLEHMAEPWKQVAAFREHLQPDGLLVVSVPCSHYFWVKYHAFRLMRLLTSRKAMRERAASSRASLFGLCHTHLYNFTPRSLSLLLEDQGFEVLHVGGIGWLSRYWLPAKVARALEIVSFGKLAVFPGVIAVARKHH